MKRLVLSGAALFAVLLGSGAALYASGVRFYLPGIDRGYSPVQPIAFSHRLHCSELEMRCLYCHSAADDGRSAGVPAASVCMNCHRYVHVAGLHGGPAAPSDTTPEDAPPEVAQPEGAPAATPVAPELHKLYDAVGFDPATSKYVDGAPVHPIEWIKVHDLPDFVSFDHSRHVRADVACQRCHGPVEGMERVAQVADLTMGWCVNCHRDVNAGAIPELSGRKPSTDCAVCHY